MPGSAQMGVVVRIDAYDPVADAAVTLRAASHDDESVCHLDGETWWPAIAQLPKLRYDLFDGDFSGAIGTPASTIELMTENWPNFGRYALADARLRLYTGDIGDAWGSWTLRFDGRVLTSPGGDGDRVALQFAVDDRWLDQPLLDLYAGTTGAEGEAAQKGKVKPLALGAPRYAPGQMIDSADTILQLHGYGAIEGVEAALENLNRFPASAGDRADFTALDGASIDPGDWETCLAEGLVRHGAPLNGKPSYLVQGDNGGPDGWVQLPGDMIRRIALLAGGSGKIHDSSLDALNVSAPYEISLFVNVQTTARQLIQRIAASVNAVAGVSWTGELFAVPVEIGGSADVTLASDGSTLPAVASVEETEIGTPFWKLAIEAERTWEEHGLGEVNYIAVLIELGAYDAGTVYRDGNIVSGDGGSRYLYTNAAPASGIALTNTSYWTQLSGPVDWDGIANTPGAFGPNLLPARYRGFTEDNFPEFAFTRCEQNATSTKNAYLAELDCFEIITTSTATSCLVYFGASTTDYNFSLKGGLKHLLYADVSLAGSSANQRWQMFVEDQTGSREYGTVFTTGGLQVYELDLTGESNNYMYIFGLRMITDSPMASDQIMEMHAFGAHEKTGALATVPAPDLADFLQDIIAATVEENADVTMVIEGGAPEHTVNYDSEGTIKPGEAGAVFNYRLKRAGAYLTSGVTGSRTVKSGSASTSFSVSSGTGTLTVNGVTAKAVLEIELEYNGIARVATITLNRAQDAATPGSGSEPPQTDNSIASVTSTSYAVIAGPLTMPAPASGNIRARIAPAAYYRTASAIGQTSETMKTQYRQVGAGSWNDVSGSEDTGSNAETEYEPEIPQYNQFAGSVTIDDTQGSLTEDVEYEFQLLGKKNNVSGTASDLSNSGSFIVEQA